MKETILIDTNKAFFFPFGFHIINFPNKILFFFLVFILLIFQIKKKRQKELNEW